MRRLMRWAARLYPAAWRARYGDELEVLLEDAGASWTDLLDILRGALVMQMSGIGFWKIAAGFTLAGALISGAWSLTVPNRYVSSAVLRIGDSSRLRELEQHAFSRTSLSGIIMQQGLYQRERARDPLEDIVQNMRNRDLRVMLLNDRQFTVSFTSDNPAAAQATVRAVVAALAEANVKVERQHAVNLEVLDPASLPAAPDGPDRGRMVGRGLVVGLVLGILCGALWSLVRGRKQWRWSRIVGFAAAGMVFGITISVLLPDEYISTAVLRAADDSKMQAALQTAFSDASLSDVIERNQLYRSDRRSGAMGPVIGKMRNTGIRVQTVTMADRRTRAFVLSFRYTDRYKAQSATRDLVARVVGGTPAEVLDPPSMPQAASSPNRMQIALFGIVAGGLLGMAASRFRRPTPAAV
jgi:uncharacterized protein involved in exopolysaccharide biosynthesis